MTSLEGHAQSCPKGDAMKRVPPQMGFIYV